MSTATVSQTGADVVLQELADLQRQCDEEQTRHRDKRNELLAKIRDTANGGCGEFQVSDGNGAPSSTVAPPPARGPKRKTAKKSASGTKSKKKGTVSASERNYDNRKTLGKAIWDILDRDEWPGLKDVPKDAVGLTAGEVKKLLAIEGDWTSNSADPGNQISAQLSKFKIADKIARGDERRYYIIKGAKFEN